MAILGIKKIVIETRMTPKLDIDLDSPGMQLDPWVRALRPKVTAVTDRGKQIDIYNPYGTSPSVFPFLAVGAIALAAVGAISIYRTLKNI